MAPTGLRSAGRSQGSEYRACRAIHGPDRLTLGGAKPRFAAPSRPASRRALPLRAGARGAASGCCVWAGAPNWPPGRRPFRSERRLAKQTETRCRRGCARAHAARPEAAACRGDTRPTGAAETGEAGGGTRRSRGALPEPHDEPCRERTCRQSPPTTSMPPPASTPAVGLTGMSTTHQRRHRAGTLAIQPSSRSRSAGRP
jgi:hypothetical protein